MKNIIKNLLVPVFASKPVTALARPIFGHGIPIFVIHRMSIEGQPHTGILPDHLRRCLNYLKKRSYTVLPLEEFILAQINLTPLPDKSVVFTMDDGFSDQALVAAPIFLEFNYPLTFFVITGLLDGALWPWDAKVSWIIDHSKKSLLRVHLDDGWLEIELGKHGKKHQARHRARQQARDIIKEMDAERISDIIRNLAQAADVSISEKAPSGFRALDWDMARNLEASDIRFAPHSQSHRILSKLPRETAEKEILGSWEVLKRELSNPLKVFCYPTGRILDFGPRETGILKKAGFLGALSTVPGFVEPGKNSADQVFRLPRFELPDNMPDFIQCCSWIEHAKRAG